MATSKSTSTETSRVTPRDGRRPWYTPVIDTGVEVRAYRGRRLRLLFCPGTEQSFLSPRASIGGVIPCPAYGCKSRRHSIISLRTAFVQEIIPISPGLSGLDTNVGLDRVLWQTYPDLRKELARRGREDDKHEERERLEREGGALRLVGPEGAAPRA